MIKVQAGPVLAQDMASALFGVEGLRVAEVEAGPGCGLVVWLVTDDRAAAACPECGTVAGRVHEYVVTHLPDVRCGGGEVVVAWVKRR